jgi:hypothetical protein
MNRKIKVALGDLLMTVGRSNLVMATRARVGRHFTAYFEPVRTKDGALEFQPHVTNEKPRWHIPFPFSQAEADRFTVAMMREVFPRWVAASSPADLVRMTSEGWRVFVPKEDQVELWAEEHLRGRDGRYHLFRNKAWLELDRVLRSTAVAPNSLDPDTAPRCPLVAYRPRNEGEETCHLSFYPNAWPAGPAGWYKTPLDWLPTDGFRDALVTAGGEQLINAFNRVFAFLGLVDAEL